MSNHEQLLKDLNMQAQSKLAQWVKDTIDLYEMAGVSAREALTTMSSEMIFMTINMLADCTVMTPEQFGRAMQESFEKRVAKNTRLKFEYLHPAMTEEHLGLLPEFLDPKDPRPARAQLHEHYAHGGGWRPLSAVVKGQRADGTRRSAVQAASTGQASR